MRKLFIIVLCLGLLATGVNAFAEDEKKFIGGNYGVGVMYSGEEMWTLTLDIGVDKWGIIFGIFGNGGESGEVRDRNTSNYGRTYIGETDESVFGIDVGYAWKIAKHLRIGVEGSMANVTQYDKYSDRRFTENYYLVETKDEYIFGAGVNAGIPLHKNFEIISSYNSIKGVSGGLMFRW